jgi:hypothetical protein
MIAHLSDASTREPPPVRMKSQDSAHMFEGRAAEHVDVV